MHTSIYMLERAGVQHLRGVSRREDRRSEGIWIHQEDRRNRLERGRRLGRAGVLRQQARWRVARGQRSTGDAHAPKFGKIYRHVCMYVCVVVCTIRFSPEATWREARRWAESFERTSRPRSTCGTRSIERSSNCYIICWYKTSKKFTPSLMITVSIGCHLLYMRENFLFFFAANYFQLPETIKFRKAGNNTNFIAGGRKYYVAYLAVHSLAVLSCSTLIVFNFYRKKFENN